MKYTTEQDETSIKEETMNITFSEKPAKSGETLCEAFKYGQVIGTWWSGDDNGWDSSALENFPCTTFTEFKAHFNKEEKVVDTSPPEEEKEKWYLYALNLAAPALSLITLGEFSSKGDAENAMRNLKCFARPLCIDTKEGPFWIEEGNTLLISQ